MQTKQLLIWKMVFNIRISQEAEKTTANRNVMNKNQENELKVRKIVFFSLQKQCYVFL